MSMPELKETTRNPWKTHKSTIRFENPWMKIVQNDVTNPSGRPGEYTVVHFKNRAVSVIPIDKDNYTWLVGQYRYAVGSFEWEIPEGGAPEGEPLLECAKRELLEETGLVAERWDLIFQDLQLSNSLTDERGYCYVARGLSQQTAEPEETEELHLRRIPLSEAIEMAVNGEIHDAFSVISLLRLKHLIDCGDFEVDDK